MLGDVHTFTQNIDLRVFFKFILSFNHFCKLQCQTIFKSPLKTTELAFKTFVILDEIQTSFPAEIGAIVLVIADAQVNYGLFLNFLLENHV